MAELAKLKALLEMLNSYGVLEYKDRECEIKLAPVEFEGEGSFGIELENLKIIGGEPEEPN